MRSQQRFAAIVTVVFVFGSTATARAQEPSGRMQREYAKLAQMLYSDSVPDRRKAVKALLLVKPADVTNAETRKKIARGYKRLADEDADGDNIRGLVQWGGKYCVPILVELLEKQKLGVPDELFDGLAKLKDPRGAAAVGRMLGNFFNHDQAVRCLRRMGSVAEDALIEVAPSNNPKASLAAVQLLGEVGSDKSIALLRKAIRAQNRDVSEAAKRSIRKIQDRQQGGTAAALDDEDPNSPFADTAANGDPPGGRSAHDPPKLSGRFFPDELKEESDAWSDGAESEHQLEDEGDWSEVNLVLPGTPAGGAQADPAPTPPATLRLKPIRLSNRRDFHERPVAFSVGGNEHPAAVIIHGQPFDEGLARLEYIDLEKGKVVQKGVPIAGGINACCLSPTGKYLLTVAQEGRHDAKARLDVWELQSGRPTEVATWRPYASGDHWKNRMLWAAWVDDQHLLAVNFEGQLVLWRIDGLKAVYQLDLESFTSPALSPGRTYIAAVTSRGVELFRSLDAELLVRLKAVPIRQAHLAFSPSGARLAALSGTKVVVWDVSTGKLQRHFNSIAIQGQSLNWLDEKLLLAGGDVVDVDRRAVVWHYDYKDFTRWAQFAGKRWGVLEKFGGAVGLVPVVLPHEGAREASAGVNADAVLAVQPGTKVSLDVRIGGGLQAEVQQVLTAAIEASGLEMAPNQPIRVVAATSTKSEEQRYRRFGESLFSEGTKVNVQKRHYEVRIEVDGETAWVYQSMQDAPMHLQLKGGESIQQGVNRETRESAGYFKGCRIPQYVVHPKSAGPLGTSLISAAGIQ